MPHREGGETIDGGLIVALAGKGGRPPPRPAPMKKEPEMPAKEEGELRPDFRQAGMEFLDDTLSEDERLTALKRAIEACMSYE